MIRAMGITCGIGSMLIGAKAAGCEIVGNIEWRKYYHKRDNEGRNTFRENYPGAFFVERFEQLSPEQVENLVGKVDIALGHPECGMYSQMNNNNKNFREQLHDPGDIPLFCELVNKIRPRFFVMDDLPKSLIAFGAMDYAKALPDYDLFFEWISNYHYGNVQKNRKRLFVIGALKTEKFVFVPGEFEHSLTVKSQIEDLLGKERDGINAHHPHELDVPSAKGQHMLVRNERATWRQVSEFVADKKGGFVLPYIAEDGSTKTRPGSYKAHWGGHGHVLDGGSPALHPLKGVPFTIRERARIQGFPDSFIFHGIKLNENGEWNHDKNIEMVKQTGKAMPVQFTTYVTHQILAHIKAEPFVSSNARLLASDPYIDGARKLYRKEVGYSDQERACRHCHITSICKGPQMDLPCMADTKLDATERHKEESATPRERRKSAPRTPRPSAPTVRVEPVRPGVFNEEPISNL